MTLALIPSAYLLFVAVVFWLMIRVVYPRPGLINRVFDEYARPVRLRATIGLWLTGMIAVFLFVQFLRTPYFAQIGRDLLHPQSSLGTVGGAVRFAGVLLVLLCELVVVSQWIVYLTNCWYGASRYRLPLRLPLPAPMPRVLVLIPCCNEEPAALRRSLSTVPRLRYSNLRVILVENSRREAAKRQAVAMAARYGVEVLHIPNRGHKAGALNDALRVLNENYDYLAVFDADQRVQPELLEDVVPLLSADGALAFVQTPQLYESADASWLGRAAAQQEMMLYDTIQEGKSANGRALCCGTNLVIRRAALDDVGGWDESTLSEDLATSFRMHWRGWKSLYVRRAYAVGLGPLNLPAYWKQQRRWAVGNTSVLRAVLIAVFGRRPQTVSAGVAIDYIWSAGFYVNTLALAVLATVPMLMILAGRIAGPAAASEWIFLSVYPLYAVVMLFPYVHMRLRGYPLRNLLLLQGLLAVTIPVYVASVLKALVRKVTFFETSPKDLLAVPVPLWRTAALYVFAVLLAGGAALSVLLARQPATPILWIALFWTFFYTVSLGHFFIFAAENKRILARRACRRRRSARSPAASPDPPPLTNLHVAPPNVQS